MEQMNESEDLQVVPPDEGYEPPGYQPGPDDPGPVTGTLVHGDADTPEPLDGGEK